MSNDQKYLLERGQSSPAMPYQTCEPSWQVMPCPSGGHDCDTCSRQRLGSFVMTRGSQDETIRTRTPGRQAHQDAIDSGEAGHWIKQLLNEAIIRGCSLKE